MSNYENYYDEMAEKFRHSVEIGQEYDDRDESLHAHGSVMQEELGELRSEWFTWTHFLLEHDCVLDLSEEEAMTSFVEEAADVLVTLFVMNRIAEIDLKGAYEAKMEYNMAKSGEKDENGKAVDDAEIEKPDFSRFVHLEDSDE